MNIADAMPYLIVILVGVLPNEMWRLFGLLAGTRLGEDAEILVWVRYVAIALVAGVVAQLVFFPSGALVGVPAFGRIGALAVALGAYAVSGRRVGVGLTAGLVSLAMAAQFAGT